MLARKGFNVTLLEQNERLEETGAGIQLSPNATHILLALGLGDRLKADIIAPEAIRVMAAPAALSLRAYRSAGPRSSAMARPIG